MNDSNFCVLFYSGKNEEILLNKHEIALECCLSSNVLCGSVPSYSDHHFERFYRNNHPVVICVCFSSVPKYHIIIICLVKSDDILTFSLQTDDFGVFSTSLTKELEIATNTFNLNYDDLIKLSRMAVNVSFAFDDEKRLICRRIEEFAEKKIQHL